MKVPGRRVTRRAALTVAAAGAAFAMVPAVARADTSQLTYTQASGSLLLVGDSSDNQYTLTFLTSGSTVNSIAVNDTADQITSPGGICTATGKTVTCTADGTHPLSSVTVVGSDGDDFLHPVGAPAGFPLTFSGDAGHDWLVAGPENDTFNGGADYDQADYDQLAGPVNVSADGVANDGEAGETDNIGADVEEIDGTDAADTLTATNSVAAGCTSDCTGLYGNDGNDTLNGGSGPDYLSGADGNDTLNGDAGDDQLAGDNGNDVLNGGAGEDELDSDPGADDIHGGPDYDSVYYFFLPYNGGTTPPSANVSLDDVANDGMTDEDGTGAANGPNVAAAGPASDNVHSDVEEIDGTDGNDTLTGDAASNVIFAGSGNDVITGGGGSDFLYGDLGDDTIAARDNTADEVVCGAGNDVATTDDIDAVSDCETNSVAKATLPVQLVQVPAPKDTTAPTVTLGSLKSKIKRKSFLKSGVSFTLSASEAVTYDAQLTGTLHGAHVAKAGDLILATKALKSSGAKTKVRLKLTSRTKKAIGKTAKLKLTVIALDASGNKKTVTKTVRITK